MNLKHLRYFRVTAHAAAGNQLHLTPQTVSARQVFIQ
jgi:DNA-binding transcriptional LysR family regulator